MDLTLNNLQKLICHKTKPPTNQRRDECNKLAQKEFMARYDWVGKVIHLELCKNLNFHNANEWNMQNPESIREN